MRVMEKRMALATANGGFNVEVSIPARAAVPHVTYFRLGGYTGLL